MKKILTFLLVSASTFGKDPYFKTFVKTTNIAYSIGNSGYFGDLAPFKVYSTTALKSARFNVGVEVSHTFKRNLTHRFNLNYVLINSSDRYYDSCSSYSANYIRNRKFTTDIIELSTSYQYETYGHKYNPYVHLGVGGMIYSVRAGVSGGAMTIPFGAGVKTKLSSKMALALELNYRYTSTDLLDGLQDNMSKVESSNASLQKGADLFYTLNLKIIYRLKAHTCPRI